MGLAGATRPCGNESAQLLAGGGPAPGVVDAGAGPALGGRGRLLLLGLDLLVLTLAQQGRHLLGLEQAGQTQVLLLLDAADHGAGAELPAVEQDPVELGGGVHGLEGAQQVVRGLLRLVGLGQETLLGGEERILVGAPGPAQDVVAGDLDLTRQPQQGRDGGQEHRGGLAAGARADEAPDGLGEEQRGRGGGRVHPDRQARHVHALGDHAHRHHPAVLARGEGLDAAGGAGVVGQDHGGGLSGDGAEPPRVGAGRALVRGDDEPAGVGHLAAHLAQPLVGGRQDRGDPLPRGVQGRAPGLGLQVLGQRLPQPCGHLVAGPGAPAHLAGVGHEHHRAHDPVAQGVGVVVGVVGPRPPGAAGLLDVAHERDGRLVGAEGRAGQGQTAARRREGLADGVAPAPRVPAVVDLVENHQGADRVGATAVKTDIGGDLGVGQGRAVEARAQRPLGVRVRGVQADSHAGGGLGPLVLQVLGGAHDRDPVDVAGGEQLGGDAQGEGGLARPGRGHGQEVLGQVGQVLLQRGLLPGPQRPRGAPGGALRVGGRKVLGGEDGRLGRAVPRPGTPCGSHRPPLEKGKRGKRGPSPPPGLICS